MTDHHFGSAAGRPNILLITTDEERYKLARLEGFTLPARDWLHQRGTSFDNYYVASAMCSSSPVGDVHRAARHRNQDLRQRQHALHPAAGPAAGDVGHDDAGRRLLHRIPGQVAPVERVPDTGESRPTAKALQPYGFTEFNDWGDIDGGAWAGLKVDPVIAGQAVRWPREKAPVVARDQPWFMTVNFVNPHDIMSYGYGSTRSITPPPNLAEAVKVKPPAQTPLYRKMWDIDVPHSASDDLSGPRRRSGSTPAWPTSCSDRSSIRRTGGWA